MGHSTSHKRAALGATACITHLQIPASTPLPQGVEQGSPWLFAAAGWSDIKSLVAASFCHHDQRVGFGLVVKFLTLTKSVGMASLVPTDPTTLSSGLPRVLS